MSQTIDQVFSDYNVQGVPASGEKKPSKAEIRALLKMIQNSGGQAVTRNTLSALNGVTPPNEDYMGIVLTGPEAGYYSRSGGAWVFGRPFPDTVAGVALSGSGTAQTGTLNPGVNPASVLFYFAEVDTPNTGPLELTIGGVQREVLNAAGNPLSPGEWTGGVQFRINPAGKFQLINDAWAVQHSIEQADRAEGEADRAEGEADRAENEADRSRDEADRAAGYAAGVVTGNPRDFITVAALLIDTALTYSGSTALSVASGDIITAQGFRYEVVASDAIDAHVETAGGVKLFVLPQGGNYLASQFGDNFTRIGDFLRANDTARVVLDAGQTYVIETPTFLPRVVCLGGRARVVVDGGTLHYEEVPETDSIDLENIDFVVVGDRADENTLGNGRVYRDVAQVLRSRIVNCTATALTDINDPESWSDDVGKTRHPGFLRVTTDNSYIENVTHYGFGVFYTIQPSTSAAVHFEKDVHGYNCETNVWVGTTLSNEDFSTGHSENLSIYNTVEQQGYWIGRITPGRLENGKDTLLCEAGHLEKWAVRNIRGHRAIERSAYLQSNNMDVDGLHDYKSLTGAHIKSATERDNNRARNITNVPKSGVTGAFQHYGQTDLIINGITSTSEEKVPVRTVLLSSVSEVPEKITIKDIHAENQDVLIYLTGSGSGEYSHITVDDARLYNVFSPAGGANIIDYVSGTTFNCARLDLSGIRHRVDDPAALSSGGMAAAAYNLINTADIYINDCEGWSRWSPFRVTNAESVVVKDSRFSVASNNSFSVALGRMRGDALFYATDFDFWVDVLPSDAVTRNISASVRMARSNAATLVNCAANWRDISFGITIPNNTAYEYNVLSAQESFYATVNFRNSMLRFFYDHPNSTFSVIDAAGNELSTSDLSLMRVGVFSGSLQIRTTSTTKPGGDMRIALTR